VNRAPTPGSLGDFNTSIVSLDYSLDETQPKSKSPLRTNSESPRIDASISSEPSSEEIPTPVSLIVMTA